VLEHGAGLGVDDHGRTRRRAAARAVGEVDTYVRPGAARIRWRRPTPSGRFFSSLGCAWRSGCCPRPASLPNGQGLALVEAWRQRKAVRVRGRRRAGRHSERTLPLASSATTTLSPPNTGMPPEGLLEAADRAWAGGGVPASLRLESCIQAQHLQSVGGRPRRRRRPKRAVAAFVLAH
jgi:hypothetical protein